MPDLRCTRGAFYQAEKTSPEVVIPGAERLQYVCMRQVTRIDMSSGDGLGRPVAGKSTIAGALWVDSPEMVETLFDLTRAGQPGGSVLGVRYTQRNRNLCKRFFNVLFGVSWGGGNRLETVAGPDGGQVTLQRITFQICIPSVNYVRDFISTTEGD